MSKLVIIDKDPMEHFVIKHLLKENTYFSQVTHATDANLVIEFIEEHKHNPDLLPDIIFLDLTLPHLGSCDFLNGLLNLYNQLLKDIDVYLLSPSIHDDDVKLSTQYPFVRSLFSKPLDEEALTGIIVQANT